MIELRIKLIKRSIFGTNMAAKTKWPKMFNHIQNMHGSYMAADRDLKYNNRIK